MDVAWGGEGMGGAGKEKGRKDGERKNGRRNHFFVLKWIDTLWACAGATFCMIAW